jgi:hypothetical protein
VIIFPNFYSSLSFFYEHRNYQGISFCLLAKHMNSKDENNWGLELEHNKEIQTFFIWIAILGKSGPNYLNVQIPYVFWEWEYSLDLCDLLDLAFKSPLQDVQTDAEMLAISGALPPPDSWSWLLFCSHLDFHVLIGSSCAPKANKGICCFKIPSLVSFLNMCFEEWNCMSGTPNQMREGQYYFTFTGFLALPSSDCVLSTWTLNHSFQSRQLAASTHVSES